MQGEFDSDEEDIYMIMSDGLEDEHESNITLKLLALNYGLKTASIAFCKKLKRS